ncbi:MAG: MraY family glycosyltransferase [Acidimicrobiales bacterium]
MSALSLAQYPVVFAATLSITLVLTPLFLKAARRWNFLDHPGAHKAQESAVPYLGGAAIVLAFVVVVLGAALYRPPVSGMGELTTLLGLALGLSAVGLVDDIRGLGPLLRLAIEVFAAYAVWLSGASTQLGLPRPVDAAITVVWVVGVTNAFNLLDNMDGLSAGVASIAALAMFAAAYINGQFLVATLAMALAGCAVGFLRHNFHPARIYMGDAGSLFLGFLLAVLGLKLRSHNTTRLSLLVPVVILGVALFDTTLVMATRLLHRRNPLLGGRDHTSHRLVFVGIPVPVSVGLIYGAALVLGWLGVVMVRVDRLSTYLLGGLALSVAGVLGVLLGAVPVYETSHRRHLMLQEVVRHEGPQSGNRDNATGLYARHTTSSDNTSLNTGSSEDASSITGRTPKRRRGA